MWIFNGRDQLARAWATLNGVSADDGSSLATRFASRSDLLDRDREIARQLAAARLGVFVVRRIAAPTWLELEAFDGSGTVYRAVTARPFDGVTPGSLVLARLVHLDGVTTMWGPACRYPHTDEGKWRAFLDRHDLTTPDGSLAALAFIPDDHAEPLVAADPLFTAAWSIDSAFVVRHRLFRRPEVARLGREIDADDGYAFAWLGRPGANVTNLGGWSEDPEHIEVARLTVHPHQLCVSSSSREVLSEVERWVDDSVDDLRLTLSDAA